MSTFTIGNPFSSPAQPADILAIYDNALTWKTVNDANIKLGEASDNYHGAPNNLGWFYGKTFRSLRLFNTWTNTAGISLSDYPSVSMSQPFKLTSAGSDGSFITPKTISHNDYTVAFEATTPSSDWVWFGWYTVENGGGQLITTDKEVSPSNVQYTNTKFWYAYHGTFGGGFEKDKCLDGDSDVLLSSGEYKKVKDLQVGELLMSASISDKPNNGYDNNMASYMNWNDHSEIPEIVASNSLIDSIQIVERKHLKVINDGLLKMSIDHPVLVRKELIDGTTAWTVRGAFNIEVGDILLATNGQQIEVDSVEVLEGNFELYELYVTGNDTISVNDVTTIVKI